jgi:hypothetical protein
VSQTVGYGKRTVMLLLIAPNQRDISMKNMMYYRDQDGQGRGMLNDSTWLSYMKIVAFLRLNGQGYDSNSNTNYQISD